VCLAELSASLEHEAGPEEADQGIRHMYGKNGENFGEGLDFGAFSNYIIS